MRTTCIVIKSKALMAQCLAIKLDVPKLESAGKYRMHVN